MKTFIQLLDNIGFAVIKTLGDVDHTNTPNNVTAIEVFTDEPDQFLSKIYNGNNSWSDAPQIRFAELNESGDILEIRQTVFVSEIPNSAVVLPEGANGLWKFINNEWVAPTYIEPIIHAEASQIDTEHTHDHTH